MNQPQTALKKYISTDKQKEIWCINEAEVEFLLDQIYQNKEYDTNEINFDSLNEESLIVDIGSNVGLFSLYSSDITNKRCNIIAIEPIPALAAATKKNLDQNQHPENKYEIYQYAIGDTSSFLENRNISFTYYPRYSLLSGIADNYHQLTFNEKMNIVSYCLNGNSFYLKLMNQWLVTNIYIIQSLIKFVVSVILYLILDCYFLKTEDCESKLYSLDEILNKSSFNTDAIDLVKIDVEKAELNVLKGIGEETWKKIKQIAIEVHDIDDRIETVKQMLIQRGFKNIHVTDKMPPKFYNFIMNGNASNDDVCKDDGQWNELVANIYASK